MGSLQAGVTGGGLEQEPPVKRRRLSEKEQPLHKPKNENVSSSDPGEGQASVESLRWECECVVALATEVCRVEGEEREKCRRLHEVYVPELLNRYRTEMQRYVPPQLTIFTLDGKHTETRERIHSKS